MSNVGCYTSMDSSQQALQINGKLFPITELFFELVTIFRNNVGVGFMQARGGGHLC